jgi:MFS family permease
MEPGLAIQTEREVSTGRWIMIALLFTAILVNYIDRGNLSIVALPLMQDFRMSPVAMGTLLSAFFWSYTLLQIPAGWMVDRFGLKWTYGAAFLLWSLASAAVGFAGSFAQILALRVLLGVGEAAAQPASLAYIRRSFPEDRQGLPTAVYLSGMMIGPAVGAFCGAALLASIGWRLLFILTGAGALVWLLPWAWLAPAGATPIAARDRAATGPGLRVLLLRPTIWGIAIGAFFYSYFWYFCLTWLPTYLVMARNLSFLKMGTFTALPLLVTAAVSMTSARVADQVIARRGHPITVRKFFVGAGFLLGSSLAFTPALRSTESVFALLVLSLFGVGVAGANYWALTEAASPANLIGRVIGVQNTIANAAGICAPVITGFVVARTKSFDLALVIAGAAMVVAAACFLFLVREKDVRLA